MTDPYKKEKLGHRDGYAQRDDTVKTHRETTMRIQRITVMHPQAKGWQRLPENHRKVR